MKRSRRLGFIATGIILSVAAVWAVDHFRVKAAVSKAQTHLAKGFASLAAEALDAHASRLAQKADGCALLIEAYSGARRLDRLQWAAEKCLEAGVRNPQVVLVFATLLESSGKDREALELYGRASAEFPQSPLPDYRAGTLLKRLGRPVEAAQKFLTAYHRDSSQKQFGLDLITLFNDLGQYKDALPIAEKLAVLPTANPEAKLIFARVFAGVGQKARAKELVKEARSLMNGVTEAQRVELEQTYGKLLRLQ